MGLRPPGHSPICESFGLAINCFFSFVVVSKLVTTHTKSRPSLTFLLQIPHFYHFNKSTTKSKHFEHQEIANFLEKGSWAELPEVVDPMIWRPRLQVCLELTRLNLRTRGSWKRSGPPGPDTGSRHETGDGEGQAGKRRDERKGVVEKEPGPLPPRKGGG